ncbi:MAG: hypothetical protein Q9222_000179 [Ikaeria aurantiellina]
MPPAASGGRATGTEAPPAVPPSIEIHLLKYLEQYGYMSIENLKTFDPFAEADEDTGETKQSQNYIHIRIQQRNGRKTLTTVQGLPKKFDQKKILKVIKKKFAADRASPACNGTIVNDTEMGEVIQLQGDQRKDVQEFLVDKKEGLALDAKTIKVRRLSSCLRPWFLDPFVDCRRWACPGSGSRFSKRLPSCASVLVRVEIT